MSADASDPTAPSPGPAPAPAAVPETRRASPRKRRALTVECRGSGGFRLEAKTVDVSRGGMLLEVTDEAIVGARATRGHRSPDVVSRIQTRRDDILSLFPDGLDVSFGEGAVVAHAVIARLVSDPERPEAILLGCRFSPLLSPVDCRLLGVEVPVVPVSDPRSAVPDPLIRVIDTPNDPWTDRSRAADARPVVRRVLPKIKIGGRISVDAPAPAPAATPLPAPAKPTAPAGPAEALLSDDALREMGAARAASPRGAVATPASAWVSAGEVAVFLFPSAGAFAPRYHGRLALFDDRNVVVDLPVPENEADPIGHAAGLGTAARGVFLRNGRVLGEAKLLVVRIDSLEDGAVRVAFDAGPTPDAALADAVHADC